MPRDYSVKKKILWRLEYAGYRLMEFVLHWLPLVVVDLLGSLAGSCLYWLSPRYRHLATRNLRLAFGHEMPLGEIRQLAHRTCQRTIANFLATLKTTTLETSKVREHVSLVGVEALQRSLSTGKGAILVLGHMGNWEILNRLHQYLPAKTRAGGIYQALTNPLVDDLLLRRRQQDGSRMFNKRDGFHGPASFVREGGLLIVVVDQKAERVGVPISFFGRLTPLSTLPALLARKTKVPVFAAGIATTRPGQWQVRIEKIGTSPDTQTIIHRLEGLIRESPADYLWLHDRWKLNRRHPLSIHSHKRGSAPANSKPVRILLIVGNQRHHESVAAFFADRSAHDLPLAPEWLIVDELDELNDTTGPRELLADPTPAEIRSKIRELDFSKPAPLELVIIIDRSFDLFTVADEMKAPRVIINRQGLLGADYLATLVDSELARDS